MKSLYFPNKTIHWYPSYLNGPRLRPKAFPPRSLCSGGLRGASRYGAFHQWGYPTPIAGWVVSWKIHPEMDDGWWYPHFRKPPYICPITGYNCPIPSDNLTVSYFQMAIESSLIYPWKICWFSSSQTGLVYQRVAGRVVNFGDVMYLQ